MNRIEQIILQLQLEPHPEGGFFRETYRSGGKSLVRFSEEEQVKDRNFATCIYFLLTFDHFSAFHRIKQDEIWHFYEGTTVQIEVIDSEGVHTEILVGNRPEKGEVYQCIIPAGSWFAAVVKERMGYALVGCTVAPGFEFEDFELASRKELIQLFPQHQTLIINFTR